MNRREFIVAASGVSGVAAVATATIPVGAQDNDSADNPGNDTAEGNGNGNGGAENGETAEGDGENGNGTAESGGGGGGGGTETVDVVDSEFQPDSLTIEPGTTVEFVWQSTSSNHNVVPTSQPDEANWEGHTDLENGDFSFESTFDVEGDYEYQCDPHVSIGMTGSITVDPEAGAGGGEADVDIHDIGVPLQKHFLGIATLLAIFVSLVFTFFVLKYGESAHSSSPGRR